ncbi:MAG: hypothetical protein NZ853_04295 [Leptospiraceae bacterium]|nr:hypothetical protein [Leptospiraceae bacterium]MDW7975394.1 hypothetical protein [Leptospiraceae bacterium]
MQCHNKVLIVSNDYDIIQILREILLTKNLHIDISSTLTKISNDYCLIIIGPDMAQDEVIEYLRGLRGILPNFLFLENENSFNLEYVSCKCKRLALPMEIFYLEDYVDSLLALHHYS